MNIIYYITLYNINDVISINDVQINKNELQIYHASVKDGLI